MASIADQPKLAPAVQRPLAELRRRIRQYVWMEGITAAIAWLGVAFWGSLAVDWFFEPPREVRGLLIGIVVVVLLVVLFRLIGRRAFVPLTDGNMATLLERRFPQFDHALLTAVELTGRGADPAECNPRMLAHTCRRAAGQMSTVRLGKVFNPSPLRRSVAASLLLAASVAMFLALAPEALGTWARRNLLFSDELWPRRTRMLVEGFEDGERKVARGADLEVIAKADVTMPVVPEVVHVRYRTDEGARGREPMSREGAAESGKDAFQEYSYTFRGVLAPIRFDVIGGDDAVRDLRIEVVESPAIVEMVLQCRFPRYTGRRSHREPVTGVMQLPRGTQVTVLAKANKDLVGVQVDSHLEEEPVPPEVIELSGKGPQRRSFEYTLSSLDEDKTLLFTLTDTDGIKSREPLGLSLTCTADQPPQLVVRLRGIGTAITPMARLPAVGRITDDYGIAKVWLEYAVDQGKPENHPVDSPPEGPAEM